MKHPSRAQLLLLSGMLLARAAHSFRSPGPSSFSSSSTRAMSPVPFRPTTTTTTTTRRYLSTENDLADSPDADLKFSRGAPVQPAINLNGDPAADVGATEATTTTTTTTTKKNASVNERLLAELKAQEDQERNGARSSIGKKLRAVDGYGRPRKTDAEIRASIERARDLNGVNPAVALAGGFFALGVAAGLWYATGRLGSFFALHPVDSDLYFVQRSAQVVRNVSMGLISLASGFFGVTGLGIFLLGVRVSYGVLTGELDPTPIKRNRQAEPEKVNLKEMFDLMTNKKPGRRGGRGGGGSDSNMFGL